MKGREGIGGRDRRRGEGKGGEGKGSEGREGKGRMILTSPHI